MKRCFTMALAALIVSATVPAFATNDPNQEKVICDLASKNCVSKAANLEKRIRKLNAEIKKGDRKYSPDELKRLEMKLQEAQDQLDKVESTAK